jgi:hypothetical protein
MSKSLTFHQAVQTPNGPGIIQGVLHEKDKPDRIIVSHALDVAFSAGLITGQIRGIWHLCHYALEDVE